MAHRMNDLIQNFIMARFPIVGLAAYSVHSSKTLLDCQCLSKSVYAATAELMLTSIVVNGGSLLSSGGRPAHYSWTYEGHQVYVALRPDGLAMALLMENNVNVQRSAVKDILQGFLDLQAA